MPKRELHHFQYICDGMTPYGAKCVQQIIIKAYDSADADYRIAQERDEFTGLRWSHTHLGWLCNAPHRDDPRLKGGGVRL